MKDSLCILKNLKVEILDVTALGKYLNRSSKTIYRWMKLKDPLPFHKVGGRFIFFKDEVLQWISNK